MPGPTIIFRTLDVGFTEPTVLYVCIEQDNCWQLIEEVRFPNGTLDQVALYINEAAVAPNKPLYVPDDMPQIRSELRRRGIRVRWPTTKPA